MKLSFVSFVKRAKHLFPTSKNFQKDGKLYDNTQHSTNIDYRP